MKIEERLNASAGDLAKLLTRAAKSVVETREVAVADGTILLPENFEVRLKYKEKQEKAKFKIEIVWTPSGHGVSPGITDAAGSQINVQAPLPGGYKQLKKLMEEALGMIENRLRSGSVISEAELEHWRKVVDACDKRGKPEWSDPYGKFQAASELLTAAIEEQDIPQALLIIAGMRDLKVKYHDIYKKKR